MKLLIKPSRGAVKKFRTRLRGEWRNMRGQNITAVLQRFNPVIRGWANYYRGVVSKVTFAKLDNWMFQHEVRWAKRTHPKKSWNWLKRRYWGRLRRNSRSPWVFGDANGSNAPLLNFSWTPIERHVIVKGTNSPDDPTLDAYWENRNKRRHTKLSRRQQAMAESQNGICLVCGESLHNGERLYTHNPKPWKVDGAQYLDDQQLLHLYCHQQLLAKEKQDRRRKRFA